MTQLRAFGVARIHGQGSGSITALAPTTLALDRGDALAVTGASGCGKSSLLHILGTLDRPSSGQLQLDGSDPFLLDDHHLARFRNRHIGFVFQGSHLLPQYSVIENIMLPAFAAGRAEDGTAARAAELLSRVGLSHRLHQRPHSLSGGERQRVAVARALLLRPGLLLCDEPTGSLDPVTAREVADVLLDLHRETGGILIVATHNKELAERLPRRLDLARERSPAHFG